MYACANDSYAIPLTHAWVVQMPLKIMHNISPYSWSEARSDVQWATMIQKYSLKKSCELIGIPIRNDVKIIQQKGSTTISHMQQKYKRNQCVVHSHGMLRAGTIVAHQPWSLMLGWMQDLQQVLSGPKLQRQNMEHRCNI